MTGTCPLCEEPGFAPVLTVDGVPTEEGYFPADRAEAAAATLGSCTLCHCAACGFVYDTAPRPAKVVYDVGYTTFMGHSPSYARHVTESAEWLVAEHGLGGGLAVDIGCGFGDFLEALVVAGMAAGVGIDPAAGEPRDPRVRVVREQFRPELVPADAAVVSCRHLLYMVEDPRGVLTAIRESAGAQAPLVYLELMNWAVAAGGWDPWDVTYEHYTYFTAQSARRLLQVAGFEVLDVRVVHHGRILAVTARPAAAGAAVTDAPRGSDLAGAVAGLQERADARIGQWRAALSAVRGSGGRIVAWCAGARAISFLSVAGAGAEVAAIVDVSPGRHGRYVPGVAIPVVPPDAVPELAPDAVLVTNPAYTSEIREDLARRGLGAVPVLDLDDREAPADLVALAAVGTGASLRR